MPPRERRCFIIGPMRDKEDENGLRWLQRLARNIIEPLLKELNLQYKVVTPYDLSRGGGFIMDHIISEIDRTDFVIADLTKSTPDGDANPNVMYELAICHCLGRPTITIGDQPPFDLGGFKHVFLKENVKLEGGVRSDLIFSIQAVDAQLNAQDTPVNPVTRFYGAPL